MSRKSGNHWTRTRNAKIAKNVMGSKGGGNFFNIQKQSHFPMGADSLPIKDEKRLTGSLRQWIETNLSA